MIDITLYEQARRDGGRRSGIEVGEHPAFTRFEEGTAERDPTLVWYIDVRCSGPRLPRERDSARQWLLRHAQSISQLLRKVADDLPVGSDPNERPIQRTGRIDGAKVVIACSAVGRIEARNLPAILNDFADRLINTIESLAARPAA